MEDLWSTGERVAVRVALEAVPFQDARVSPCRLQSLAICKAGNDSFVLYIGSDNGYIFRYALSFAVPTESVLNSPDHGNAPVALVDSVFESPTSVRGNSFSAAQSETHAISGTPSSPVGFVGDPVPTHLSYQEQGSSGSSLLPAQSSLGPSSQSLFLNPPRPSSADSASKRPPFAPVQASASSVEDDSSYSPTVPSQKSGARTASTPSTPRSGGIPFSRSLPQITSLYSEFGNGSSAEPSSSRPASPAVSAQSMLDANSTSFRRNLTSSKRISKHPIETICVLPECSRIAVIAEDQVMLLGSESLNLVDFIPMTRGALTLARCLTFESTSSREVCSAPRVLNPERPSKALTVRNEMTMKSLFSRGKMSSRFGGIVGGLGEAFGGVKDADGGKRGSRSGSSRVGINSTTSPSVTPAFQKFDKLAVALKDKIVLYEVGSSELESRDRRDVTVRDVMSNSTVVKVKELTGIEGVLTLAWFGDVIIAGTVQEYMLISLVTDLPTTIFSLPQEVSWRPFLKAFPMSRQALLLIDNAGIPVDTEGRPAGGSLQFQVVPDSVGYSAPYVVVVKQDMVELYHHITGLKMQSFSLQDAGKVKSIAADDDNGQVVVIANSFKVWCLRQIPVEEQIKEVLRKKAYDDAVRLAEEAQVGGEEGRTKYLLAMVHAEAGFLYLFDLHFKEAVNHFLQSEILEPVELFSFFPDMTSRWRSIVPRKRYWGLHPPPQQMATVIESGLLAIKSGLLRPAPLLEIDGSLSEDLYLRMESGKAATIERFLVLAMQNVARYLDVVRRKDLRNGEKEGVDTLLMKLYIMLQAASSLEDLASSSNSCILEEVESLLKNAGQLRGLALMYESKGILDLALQVWQTLAHSESSVRDTGSFNSRLAAAKEAARLLEVSSDSDLVLQHLDWIIKIDENLALDVLTSSKRAAPIGADDALLLLKTQGGSVHQRFLRWLVKDQELEDTRYHTELALSLAKSSLGTIADMTATGGISSMSQDNYTHSVRLELLTFLESSDFYDAQVVLNNIQDSLLWREQFVLHRKLGDELSALRTLALKLEDSQAAESYCAEIGRPEVYSELMNMYLNPDEGKAPMHRAAVSLLHCPGANLDPMQLLEALAPDMPLSAAAETISQMLVSRVHRHRQGQIVKQMNRKENLDSRIARVEEKSRHVSITVDTVCGSCNARIGTKLFALYPTDTVFCYKCLRQYGAWMRPSTHR